MHNDNIRTVLGMGGLVVHRHGLGLGLGLGLAVVRPRLLCRWLGGEKYMHKNDIRTSHEVRGLILHWLGLGLRLAADHPRLLCGSLLVRKIRITIIYVLRKGVLLSSENCNVVKLVYPYRCQDYLQLRIRCSPHCPNAKY